MKIALSLAMLATSSLAHAQQTWVVDQALAPGADFDQIQPAVDAAAPGDVILVRQGLYAPVRVQKGVTITAETGVIVKASIIWFLGGLPAVWIDQLPLGQTCVLDGLELRGNTQIDFGYSHYSNSLLVQDCLGNVLVEDCTWSITSAVVQNASSLAFVRCEGSGLGQGEVRTALQVEGSGIGNSCAVYAYASTFVGPNGSGTIAGAPLPSAKDGIPGVRLKGSGGVTPYLYLDGCTCVGGEGGPITAGPATCGGTGTDGGLGVDCAGGKLVSRASDLIGGAAGFVEPGCDSGVDGASTDCSGVSLTLLAVAGPRIAATSPVREGEVMTVTLSGDPGDLAFVMLAASLQMQDVPAFQSPLMLPPLSPILSIGAFPPGGQIVASPTVGPLAVGVEGLFYALQIASCDLGAGTCVIGNPTLPVVLDASF